MFRAMYISIYIRDLDCCSQKGKGGIPFSADKETEAHRNFLEKSHNSE